MLAGLARTAHLGPCLAITVLTVLVGVASGVDAWTLLGVGIVVLLGQLSIGWSNDVIDADRDRAAQRTDKPIAAGEVAPRLVWTAALVSLTVALVSSLLLGIWFAVAHAVTVAAGWAYNLWLKRSWASGIAFVVSFGLLPSLARLAGDTPRLATVGETLAAATIGFSVHLANTLPDLDDDVRAGVRGLPHLLGRRGTAAIGFITLIAGAVVLTVEIGHPVALVGLALVIVIGVWGLVASLNRATRLVFRLVVAAALLLAVELVVVSALR